jgi:hypothetical protein
MTHLPINYVEICSPDLAKSRAFFEAAEAVVKKAGGVITLPPFKFPEGRRFQFREPGGNELAVWSEK